MIGKIIADTHTHTIASGHAFGTVTENAAHARRMGLEYLFLCEHTKAMIGAAQDIYFESTMCSLPERLCDVYLVRGCEANFIDLKGNLDMDCALLKKLEWVIASMHTLVIPPVEDADYTEAWLAAAENPDVDALGHCGDGRYPFDHETVIKACARTGTIVEINSHSFGSRPKSPENCRDIALLCAKYSVPVVVSSDAHFWTLVGEFSESLKMLNDIDFPDELVINADKYRMAALLEKKCPRKFTFDER